MPDTLETPPAPTGLKGPEFQESISKLFPEETPEPIVPVTPTPADKPPAPTDKPPVEDKNDKSWDTDDPPQDIKSEKGQQSWRHQRAAMKELRAEREKLTGELTKLKTDFEALQGQAKTQKVNVDDLPEYQTLKAERERLAKEAQDYSERLRLVDVEKHPKFQAYFGSRIEQALNAAKTWGGDRAVELLKMPPSDWRTEQLENLTQELGSFKGGMLTNAMAKFEEVNAERAQELTKAQENFKTIREQEAAAELKRKETFSKTFETVRSEVRDPQKGISVFQPRENDPEWNKEVEKRVALAEHIYLGNMQPEDAARAAMWSAAAPALLSELKTYTGKIAELEKTHAEKVADLEKQILELRGAKPTPGSENTTTVEEAPTSLKGWVDRIGDKAGLR